MNQLSHAQSPFLAVTLNPTFQKTLVVDPFRPGEVNRAEEKYFDVAGKGLNVVRILGQLGEEAFHVTHAGGGDRELYLEMCGEADVPTNAIQAGDYIRTCTTIVDRSQGVTTELVEPAALVSPEATEGVVATVMEQLPRFGTFVFAGTMAPGYPVDLPARLIGAAREAGLYVLADFRGESLKKSLDNTPDRLPNVIKINLVEFAHTFFLDGGAGLGEHTDDPEVLRKVHRHMTVLHERGVDVVITRGSQPTLVLDRQGKLRRIPPMRLQAVNTIGCGDAFAAGFLCESATGASLEDAVDRGHATAAMNATTVRPGTIRPS